MSETSEHDLLSECFREVTGSSPISVVALRAHASERRIYRLSDSHRSMIGVVNNNPPENDSFVYLARLFYDCGVPVPSIYCFKPELCLYLEQDLGDITLLDVLNSLRADSTENLPLAAEKIYRSVLGLLPKIQVQAAAQLDFNRCFPDSTFSSSTLLSDMLNFQRELVERIAPELSTPELTDDFEALAAFVSDAHSDYFLYRDFQARNIMIVNGEPFFIDFQGGRRGPLQYDVVSLLYQSSAQLNQASRAMLLEHYLQALSHYTTIRADDFHRYYGGFIVCRMLQVLGVYGKQGIGGGKEYFRNSIPGALDTLIAELSSHSIPLQLPSIRTCVEELASRIAAGAIEP